MRSYTMTQTIRILSAILLGLTLGCTYDHLEAPDNSGYPEDVSAIILTKCATPGCHNNISYGNAGGIDLSSWDALFRGGRSGSSVIPYSTAYSFLLYFVNTDSSLGPVLEPTMPFDQAPISRTEYETLYNWIFQGAPDNTGRVRYAGDPFRQKIYVCMQGCDQVATLDPESGNIMRYISVGADPSLIEAPHLVRVSPDGQYWYVVFYSGNVIQKFRCSDDSLVATLDIGSADWNTLIFTPDGSRGFVNGTNAGTTVVVDLDQMTEITRFSIDYPHGGFVTPDGHWLYLTSQLGNFVNKVDITDPFYTFDFIVLQPGETKTTASRYDPHEMTLSADGNRYFISCQTSNEVRIFQTSNDSLIATLPVGVKPQEFSVSKDFPYVYVTCTEDVQGPGAKGSVYVLNASTNTVVTHLYTGYQPHGIAVDEDRRKVYVANLNVDSNGPAPHHVSDCGGRNGYMTCIDESTLELFKKNLPNGSQYTYRQEVLRAPYFVSYRK